MKKIYFLKTCNTCIRIIKELDPPSNFVFQDIKEQPIIASQLEEMHQLSGSYEALFSKRAKLYKEMGLMHIQKLLKKLDFEYYNKVDLNNHRRIIRALTISMETEIPYSNLLGKVNHKNDFKEHIYIINEDREKLYNKINTTKS